MTDAHHARRSRRLVGVVLAAAVALLVPAVAVAAPPDGKGPSAPSSPVAGISLEFANEGVPDTPGSDGLAYVVAGEPFSVTVTFLDAEEEPVAFSGTKSTTVTLRHGTTQLGEPVDVAADEVSAGFTGLRIPTGVTDTTLTLVADTKPTESTFDSDPFDVLLEDEPTQRDVRAAIGGDGGTDTECNPTPEHPICADLVPPGSAFAGGGLLSRGLCPTTEKCRVDYIQALAPFTGDFGVGSEPATLVMKCDKDECGGGAINRKQLVVTLSPNPESAFSGTFTAPACPAKDTVDFTLELNEDQQPVKIKDGNLPFCVDYVQSTRSNAGDTFLHLLFLVDAKVRFS